MSANLKFGVSGTQEINSLNQSLKDLHGTLYSLNNLSNLANNSFTNTLGNVSSPLQGIRQGTAQYPQFAQELDQQRRLLDGLKVSYNDFANSMIASARAAGRAVQDYTAIRQELVNLGNAADVANRQISTLSFSSGMTYGQTAQFFSTLSQSGGAFSGNRNQVGFDPQSQARFMSAITDAVNRVSANGMKVSMPELLSGLTSLQSDMASRGIQANLMGNLGIMSGFSQSGGLGVFGAQGAQVLSNINQALGPNGQMYPFMQQYLAQQHPGESYYQLQYRAEEGVQSPTDLKNILQMEQSRYGRAGQDKYFMASMLARDFGLSSAHVGMDVLNSENYLNTLNPNSQAYQMISQYMSGGSLEYVGLATDIASGKYTKNGRFDAAAANAEFKRQAGRGIGGNLGDNATMAQFISQLSQEGAPGGGTNSARSIEQTQAQEANNYAQLAKNLSDSIDALKGFNKYLSDATLFLQSHGTGNATAPGLAAAIPIVGSVAGSALGGLGSVLIASMGLAGLKGGIGTAGQAIRGIGSFLSGSSKTPLEKSIAQWATRGAGKEAATTAAEDAASTGGGLTGEALLPFAAGLGLIAAGGYVGYQAIFEQPKRDQQKEASRSEQEKEARYQKFLKDTGGKGFDAASPGFFLAHPEYLTTTDAEQADWRARMARDKGQTTHAASTGATTPQNAFQPITDRLDSLYNVVSKDILEQLRNAATSLSQIYTAMNPQNQATTDKNYQARYGVGGSSSRMLNYTPGSTTYTNGGSTSTVTTSAVNSTPSISGGMGGGGFNSIVGDTSYSIGQGFGVVSPDVDQSIYTYGQSYGLAQGHTGIDVDVPRGTKVYSPVAGVVMVAGGVEPGGGAFFVDDPSGKGTPATGELRIGVPDENGDLLILGHLSKIVVHIGDKVKPGQLVAYSGTSNGDHVHVEYRKKTPGQNSGYTLVDPQQQLNSMVSPTGANGGGSGANAGPVSNGQGGGATSRWRSLIEKASKQVGINPDAVQAIMMEEDASGDPSAVSGAGAIGLMQVMPFNFLPGEDTSDPYTQILAGARYLKGQYDKYGNWNSAAAGYLGAVDANGNPGTQQDMYGMSGIKYAQLFQQHLAQLRSGGATTQEKAIPGLAVAADRNITDITSGTNGNAGNMVEFAPLTVNVVYPDGKVVTSKLPVTSQNPYNGIRQYTTRAVGRS